VTGSIRKVGIMPKVSIYERADSAGAQARRIEVGWQKSCAVQLGVTKLRPGATSVELLKPDGTTTDVSDYVSVTGGSLDAWDGQFMELDRAQINQLIRHLRDARDAAFGRDE
jgi:hypothetical protein